MRAINEIIIHCTATVEGKQVSVDDVIGWHKEKGYVTIGYHYLIGLNGEIWVGRPLEQTGAHTTGHNPNSIGICYVGGLDANSKPKDTRTEKQKTSLLDLIIELKQKFPAATIHGHKEFANKACPCFDAKTEYENVEVINPEPKGGKYVVIVASLNTPSGAERYGKKLQEEGIAYEVIDAGNQRYRVSIGSFDTLAEAQKQANQMRSKHPDVWVTTR